MSRPDYIPLNEEQLERAARFMCEAAGENPDELVPYDDGSGHAVFMQRPLYRNLMEVIAEHDLIDIAIVLVRDRS